MQVSLCMLMCLPTLFVSLLAIDEEWQRTQCMPRETCVDVAKELGTDPSMFFKPPCVAVHRFVEHETRTLTLFSNSMLWHRLCILPDAQIDQTSQQSCLFHQYVFSHVEYILTREQNLKQYLYLTSTSLQKKKIWRSQKTKKQIKHF